MGRWGRGKGSRKGGGGDDPLMRGFRPGWKKRARERLGLEGDSFTLRDFVRVYLLSLPLSIFSFIERFIYAVIRALTLFPSLPSSPLSRVKIGSARRKAKASLIALSRLVVTMTWKAKEHKQRGA